MTNSMTDMTERKKSVFNAVQLDPYREGVRGTNCLDGRQIQQLNARYYEVPNVSMPQFDSKS